MLIGSLVELHVGLHSRLCFSPLKKLVLKCGSTPPQYLIDTLVSVELLKPFSYRNPNSSSIPGGSIENAPASSIASWHLVDRSSFCSWIWFLLLDTCSIPQLSTSIFSTPTSTASSTPLDTSSVEHYWRFYLNLLVWSDSHFTRLLSVFSPKLSHLTPFLILKGFFKLFQDFLLLVSF